MDSSLIFITK